MFLFWWGAHYSRYSDIQNLLPRITPEQGLSGNFYKKRHIKAQPIQLMVVLHPQKPTKSPRFPYTTKQGIIFLISGTFLLK